MNRNQGIKQKKTVLLVMMTTDFLSFLFQTLSICLQVQLSWRRFSVLAGFTHVTGLSSWKWAGQKPGGIQLDVCSIKQLSVSFQDAQTALQQLEVSLGVFELKLGQLHQVLPEGCHSPCLKVYELLLGRL